MMTLLLALMMILLLLPAALADGAAFEGTALPAEIKAYFSASNFNNYTIGADAALLMENTAAGNYFFAVTQYNGHNVLHGFKQKNGKYEHFLRTDKALPQGEGTFVLFNDSMSGWVSTVAASDAIAIAYRRSGDTNNLVEFIEPQKSGQWNLRYLYTQGLGFDFREADVFSDKIVFWGNPEVNTQSLGTVKGTVQTDIRYFSFSAFPKSVKEAKNKLSTPPAISAASQLQAKNVKFTGGQKYAVYSGPGESFERGANGKAAVSTNDWIQVFGQAGDWILIQYAVSSDHMRFGYIPASALPKNVTVGNLDANLGDLPAIISVNTFLTDDPIKSQSVLRTLAAGQTVTWLATMDQWVYIQLEDENGHPFCRGFVPASAIQLGGVSQDMGYSGYFANGGYIASAQATVHADRTADISIKVSAPGDWLTAQDVITGYQIYGNNTLLSQNDSLFTRTAAPNGQCRFALSCSVFVPQGVGVLGLCPVYPDGVKTAETVLVFIDP